MLLVLNDVEHAIAAANAFGELLRCRLFRVEDRLHILKRGTSHFRQCLCALDAELRQACASNTARHTGEGLKAFRDQIHCQFSASTAADVGGNVGSSRGKRARPARAKDFLSSFTGRDARRSLRDCAHDTARSRLKTGLRKERIASGLAACANNFLGEIAGRILVRLDANLCRLFTEEVFAHERLF